MYSAWSTKKISCCALYIILVDAVSGSRYSILLLYLAQQPPHWASSSPFTKFLYHTQRRTTVDRTPLDERSARRRDLYLTTHNTHNTQTSIDPGGIRTHKSVGERPNNYTLDRAATGIGMAFLL